MLLTAGRLPDCDKAVVFGSAPSTCWFLPDTLSDLNQMVEINAGVAAAIVERLPVNHPPSLVCELTAGVVGGELHDFQAVREGPHRSDKVPYLRGVDCHGDQSPALLAAAAFFASA